MSKYYLIDSYEFYSIAQSLVDEGLSYHYIANACGLSSHIFGHRSKQVKSTTFDKLRRFNNDRSYHISRNRIIKFFDGIKSKPRYVLEYEGFSNWEVNRFKR